MFGLSLPTLISRIVTLVTALTVHEYSHARVADSFGDDTPRLNGRLTLNPLAHLDVLGSLMLVVAGFGWAKPVPVNPYALGKRSNAAFMWVSLAGPASNLLLAIIAAIPIRLGWVTYVTGMGSTSLLPSPYEFLREFIFINLILMLFNLIPLAPLDGDKIFAYFSPPPLARALDQIRPYGPMVLLLVFLLGPLIGLDVIGWVMTPALPNLWNLLVRGAV